MILVEIPCTLLFVSRARLSLQFHPERLMDICIWLAVGPRRAAKASILEPEAVFDAIMSKVVAPSTFYSLFILNWKSPLPGNMFIKPRSFTVGHQLALAQ
jgi:hypothetical protein